MFGYEPSSSAGWPVLRLVWQLALCQSGELIVQDAEVRAADDFQIIGQAGMRDREILRREPVAAGQLIGERHGRIADDFGVAVILHHDQKHMIEMAHAARYGTLTLARSGSAGGRNGSCKRNAHERFGGKFH